MNALLDVADKLGSVVSAIVAIWSLVLAIRLHRAQSVSRRGLHDRSMEETSDMVAGAAISTESTVARQGEVARRAKSVIPVALSTFLLFLVALALLESLPELELVRDYDSSPQVYLLAIVGNLAATVAGLLLLGLTWTMLKNLPYSSPLVVPAWCLTAVSVPPIYETLTATATGPAGLLLRTMINALLLGIVTFYATLAARGGRAYRAVLPIAGIVALGFALWLPWRDLPGKPVYRVGTCVVLAGQGQQVRISPATCQKGTFVVRERIVGIHPERCLTRTAHYFTSGPGGFSLCLDPRA